MAPFFTFFVDKKETQYAAPFIRKLDKYYPSFADSVFFEPVVLKGRYAGANAKFFAFDYDEFIMFDLETVDLIEPLVALTMDSFTRMSRKDWLVVHKFLKTVFEDGLPDMDEITKLVPIPEPLPEKILLTKSIEPAKEQKKDYDFNYLVEDNICYCQIEKPYTDLPYTIVIRDFETKGFIPLFTDIYVCQSWGVTNLDHAFLHKLWVYLNMPGDLDLENRLKNEIELCKNGKPEPEVYRLDISGVKEQLSRKKKRHSGPIDHNKFVRL
jgi:hypothetical protein